MNARHIIIAAGLACLGLAAHSFGAAGPCTGGASLCATALAAPPLNIKAEAAKAPARKASRKAKTISKTARPARKTPASKSRANKTQAREAHRDEQVAAETPAPAPAPENNAIENNAMQPQEQIPVVAVKTTRETGAGIAIVNPGEVNELDRAAAPDISLAAYSIMSYLGGAAAIAPNDEDAAPASTDGADITADARNAYASAAPPATPANHIALEYVLMTFACALAAAAAVRVFVV